MSLADSADMWFILPIHIQDLKTESRIPLNNSSKVSTVILTHCHGDHIGGLLSFRREFVAENPEAFLTVRVNEGFFCQRNS